MKVRDMMLIPATNLYEMRVNFRYFPLDSNDLEKFYVDDSEARGAQVLQQLNYSFLRIPGVYQQVAYFGHIGSGKSTMLYQLEKQLCTEYRVIRYSVQEKLDIDSIALVDLIYSMYNQIFNAFSDQCSDDLDIYREVYDTWYSTISVENCEERKATIEASAGIKLNLKALFANITNIFCTGTSQRKRVYDEVNRNISSYITLLNKLIDAYTKPNDKPILVMIEDVEKARDKEKIREVFVSHSAYFKDLKLNLLITAPIFLRYTPDYNEIIQSNFTVTVVCPMIRVANRDHSEYDKGIQLVTDIVNARIDNSVWTPIDPVDLKSLILQTGGVLRNTFEVIAKAALFSQIAGKDTIDHDSIQRALNELKGDYINSLRVVYFDLIKKFYEKPQNILDDDDDSDAFLNLIKSGVLLEYVDDAGRWIGVHPVVVDILSDRGELRS